ncbi:hypothetical protein Ahy_B09g098152 [Arachis hypogaea]|uniref:Ubiquitin-like protease family profile domain-containing protein n=1 Tax=Arachis hypogaea TaxID=3818 RepID=A0A444XQP6_ARAHY|nr:hypothetical protein Ahy_B09g098152 [Arachis hypogaea]
MMAIGVDNEQDRLMFKRIFILYIQMAFLLPTTINKISHVHLAPIFKMDTITERNWGAHVLNFIIKGITDYNLKKNKSIDGCLFVLMIVYFHLSKNKDKKRAERPPEPWIANWTREQLIERMRAEMEEYMASSTSSSETETTDSDHSTSESETEEDSEDSPRKQPSQKAKKMESKKRKKIQEDSDSESKSIDETQSKKKKVIVEDSSPEQAQSYHGSEIGTEELDEFLRENNEKSAAQGEKEADLRSTEGHYISSKIISDVNSESDDPSSQGHTDQSSINKPAESIVPIQVCLPLSQTTTMLEIEETPETENEPTPVLQIEGTTKSNPAPEDAAALMMMARTASYVPKTDPMPSFSLGLTDSSQEEAATQEGASTQDGGRAKTPKIPKLLEQLGDLIQKITSGGVTTKEKSPQISKESGTESFEKFETPARTNQHTSDMKEKCYLWAIRVKKYADGLTNEFDTNMALGNHPQGIFAPVYHSQHWWLWLADTRKQKFYIVDPYHTKSPSDERTTLNTFIDEVDHFRVEYASRILFHEMNQDKAEAIRGSNAIRLSKPSSLLLSPYCQIDSKDIDTD